MNIDAFLINKPVDNKSLSTTLVIASAVICIVAMVLEMAGVIKNTSMCLEFFLSCSALNFGRAFVSAKGASVSKEQ